jgi:hypothetical protein
MPTTHCYQVAGFDSTTWVSLVAFGSSGRTSCLVGHALGRPSIRVGVTRAPDPVFARGRLGPLWAAAPIHGWLAWRALRDDGAFGTLAVARQIVRGERPRESVRAEDVTSRPNEVGSVECAESDIEEMRRGIVLHGERAAHVEQKPRTAIGDDR